MDNQEPKRPDTPANALERIVEKTEPVNNGEVQDVEGPVNDSHELETKNSRKRNSQAPTLQPSSSSVPSTPDGREKRTRIQRQIPGTIPWNAYYFSDESKSTDVIPNTHAAQKTPEKRQGPPSDTSLLSQVSQSLPSTSLEGLDFNPLSTVFQNMLPVPGTGAISLHTSSMNQGSEPSTFTHIPLATPFNHLLNPYMLHGHPMQNRCSLLLPIDKNVPSTSGTVANGYNPNIDVIQTSQSSHSTTLLGGERAPSSTGRSNDHLTIRPNTKKAQNRQVQVVQLRDSSGRFSHSTSTSSTSSSRRSSNQPAEVFSSRDYCLRSRHHQKYNPPALLSTSTPSSSTPSETYITSTADYIPVNSRSNRNSKSSAVDFGDDAYILSSAALRDSTFQGPVAILVCWDPNDVPAGLDHSRVTVVKEFQAKLPKACFAARDGLKNGEWPKGCSFPGIPNKKYSDAQWKEFGNNEKLWNVQMLFAQKDSSTELSVLYEGWATVFTQQVEAMQKGAPEALEILKMRDSFLQEMKVSGPEWGREFADEQRFLKSGKKFLYLNHDDHFWLCQDLSYFHTVLHKEYQLAPVLYVSLERLISPPKYSYTAVNVLKHTTYNRCRQRDENLPFRDLLRKYKRKMLPKSMDKGACENKEHCVCDARARILYHNGENLRPDESGRLDFSNFELGRNSIIVECSDLCGCTSSCPRRPLQKGQKVPLIIFFEGETRWGVRAGADISAGTCVGEYTGEAFYKAPGTKSKIRETADDFVAPGKDSSYECDFAVMDDRLIICAAKIGNVMRFLNHKCKPNCVFIETHSRSMETDVLIPRVAVYALNHIKMGEALTLSYWGDVTKLKFVKSTIPCHCGSPNCIRWLPESIINLGQ